MSGFLRKFSVVCSLVLCACGGGSTEPGGAGPPRELAITRQPAAIIGMGLNLLPIIEIHDQNGRLVDTSTAAVTASLTLTGPRLASLNGETTVRAVNGVVRFPDLKIVGARGTYGLRFTSAVLTEATSAAVTVACGPSPALEIYTQPYVATSGVVLTPTILLKLRDQCGDQPTSGYYNASVDLASGAGTVTGGAGIGGVNGAEFFDLVITGPPGPKKLRFTFAQTGGTQPKSYSAESATMMLSAP